MTGKRETGLTRLPDVPGRQFATKWARVEDGKALIAICPDCAKLIWGEEAGSFNYRLNPMKSNGEPCNYCERQILLHETTVMKRFWMPLGTLAAEPNLLGACTL